MKPFRLEIVQVRSLIKIIYLENDQKQDDAHIEWTWK